MAVSAAHVSRVLAAAGHDRATAYQTFAAREVDGFIVTRLGNLRADAPVQVLHSRGYSRPEIAAPLVEAYAATLQAARYTVEIERNREGQARSIKVTGRAPHPSPKTG